MYYVFNELFQNKKTNYSVMRKLLAVCFMMTTLYQVAMANREEKIAYIERYTAIAIQEMHRSGIPASIKLAQALLESNAGNSRLAKGSNNHFGIKCGGKWDGKKMYVKDDDYKKGKLIKSCFRAYKNAESSFIAHTDFLVNQPRYAALFKLDPQNYKAWAKGLRKAGYATDPKYAQRLISVIESYQLNQFDRIDQGGSHKPLIFEGEVDLINFEKSIQYINDVKSVLAEDSYKVEDVAMNHGVSIKQILKYNEHLQSEDQMLYEGEIIYLKPKKNSYRGKQKYHRVQEGESMQFISQKYGVKLKSLYKRNRIQIGKQPAAGSKIVLRGKVKKDRIPKTLIAGSQPFPVPNPSPTPPDQAVDNVAYIEMDDSRDKKSVVKQKVLFYTVSKGDTLYGLSKRFSLSVDELKRANGLQGNNILVGQKLRVSL